MIRKNKFTLVIASVLASSMLAGCSSANRQESTGQYIDSSVITTKVKGRLLGDNTIGNFPITVKTYKSTVQLSGFVNNRKQKEKAGEIAKSVNGVDDVENDLIIKPK